MIEEIRIPEISENVTTGKVVKVLVKEGDKVEVDDILIEFETEKALVEIPSTAKGVIVELPAKEGQEMRVGDVIAKVETDAQEGASEGASGEAQKRPSKKETDEEAKGAEEEAKRSDDEAKRSAEKEKTSDDGEMEGSSGSASDADADEPQEASAARESEPKGKSKPDSQRETKSESEPASGSDEDSERERPPVAAAPSVRRFARELGVDIHQVRGSGPNGRITPDDVKAAVRAAREGKGTAAGVPGAVDDLPDMPDFSRWGEVETIELAGVRRLTARSTAVSWRLVPHVTQFDRADITPVEAFIKKQAPRMQKQGVKLTISAIVMKVCAEALRQFPRFNASIDPARERIILKKYVHIGMAVDTERGLLVPVVRDADHKTIDQLAAAIADMAERARNKKIKPDEMEGGTFTISNQGGIGGTQFTPIVMWPQVAILGMSRAGFEPVYTDGDFTPRTVLPLALSYDHRIIDGADAARFLRFICESLEQPLNLFVGQ